MPDTTAARSAPGAPAAYGDGGDFVLWAQQQAALITAGRWADVDAANVAEEIASLGASERREIRSRLRLLIMHLLKQQYQPERATPSWRDTIVEQAVMIEGVLEASPSLRREMAQFIAFAYRQARRKAAAETHLPLTTFPEEPTPELHAALAAELTDGIDDE